MRFEMWSLPSLLFEPPSPFLFLGFPWISLTVNTRTPFRSTCTVLESRRVGVAPRGPTVPSERRPLLVAVGIPQPFAFVAVVLLPVPGIGRNFYGTSQPPAFFPSFVHSELVLNNFHVQSAKCFTFP
eukprot:RCo000381